MQFARIQEIFASIQGEGPWLGQRHIFVRFLGCDIACRYCDTPESGSGKNEGGSCKVQKTANSFSYDRVSCSMSVPEVTNFCSRLLVPGPGRSFLSLTGGEPLLQQEFLSAWLPEVKHIYTFYLETNGIHYREMGKLRDLVDIVSMDFKLPSATRLRPFWREHREFLAAARGTRLFVKAVVTADTNEEDILASAKLIAGHDRTVPLIFQPADGPLAPDPVTLIRFQNAALAIIEDVRVIPQAHKILAVP